jgi:chemotaxis protein CheD
MKKEIKVRIAEYKVTKGPNRLITMGLGSCVGIGIYDQYVTSFGGLAHIMLPDSRQFKKQSKLEKFADLAIPQMVQDLFALGIRKKHMVAKIAGGASMFQYSDKSLNLDIGSRNIKAVREVLIDLGIPIIAEDVGGNSGRTMILDLEDKTVQIKKVGVGITYL